MGYGSYSEAAHQAITTARAGASAASVFMRNDCDPKMNPHGVKFRECRDSQGHPDSIGIVFALDVSGSMGEIPHQLATKTLPTFIGAVRTILPSPQLLFMAFGNAYSDKSPLQVGQFESEAALIDRWLAAIHLEGGGGGLGESYDLALWFAARHTAMDCWEKRQKKGYLFMTGDETPWMELSRNHVTGLLGEPAQTDVPIGDVVRAAMERFHVFFLIPDPKRAATEQCGPVWNVLLHERCVVLETPEDTASIAALCVGIEEGVLKDRGAIEGWIGTNLKATPEVAARLVRTITPFADAHARGAIAPPGTLYRRTDTPNVNG
jgi:hypothetical protein